MQGTENPGGLFASALLAFDRCANVNDVQLVLQSIHQHHAAGSREAGRSAIAAAIQRVRAREASTGVPLWNVELDRLLQICLTRCDRASLPAFGHRSSFRCPESRTVEALLGNFNLSSAPACESATGVGEEGGDEEEVWDFLDGS